MNKHEKIINQYQCTGCLYGSDTSCGEFKPADAGVGCGGHAPSTYITPGVGKIFLGMPRGFCRLGMNDKMKLYIYENQDQMDGVMPELRVSSLKDHKSWYSPFNVPVWKHRTKEGHVLVRGMHPRVNANFIQVILDDKSFDKINCVEISEQEIEEMD